MTNIDQFESAFKAAAKTVFHHEPVTIKDILVVTDLDEAGSRGYLQQVQGFLAELGCPEESWRLVHGGQFQSVGDLLQRVGEADPDLVCLYRNLHTPAREYPYSLGTHVDVLTQASQIPVLLTPHPAALEGRAPLTAPDSVMAMTDHLTGDDHLVSFAALLTAPQGTLHLAHVEDDHTFARYMQIISKLPNIDTETARESIRSQLLKEPTEYIAKCRETLLAENLPLTVNSIVVLGHHLTDYRRLLEEHEVKLLVMNTNDEDQLAMHGQAYPLSIELRDTPLLLL